MTHKKKLLEAFDTFLRVWRDPGTTKFENHPDNDVRFPTFTLKRPFPFESQGIFLLKTQFF